MSTTRKVAAMVGASLISIPICVLSAVPAAADGSDSSAFALSASGAVNLGPLSAVSSKDGPGEKSVAGYTSPDKVVTADLLSAKAGPGHARASVADLRLDLSRFPELKSFGSSLKASAITATCESGKGSSNLAEANLDAKHFEIAPPANTGIDISGVVYVFLNKQVKNKDGSLTVTAISIDVSGHQTLDIASATCGGGPVGTNPPPSTTRLPVSSPSAPGCDCPAGEAPEPKPVRNHLAVTG